MVKGCSKCEYYSRGLSRCTLGKINPPTIKGGLNAIRYMGLGYICTLTERGQKTRAKWLKQNS